MLLPTLHSKRFQKTLNDTDPLILQMDIGKDNYRNFQRIEMESNSHFDSIKKDSKCSSVIAFYCDKYGVLIPMKEYFIVGCKPKNVAECVFIPWANGSTEETKGKKTRQISIGLAAFI
eukprot:NODE_187_length_15673_cov_0.222743.p9 type:complete len:118 gc:universal NODE_187_length_15673_cov_0.222743:3984-3631(-)